MTKSLFLFFVLVLATNSSAQKLRFTDSTNVWHESGWSKSGSGGTAFNFWHRYHYNGDTMMNGYQYRRLFDEYRYSYWTHSSTGHSINPVGFVREDTTTGKVYIAGLGGVMTDSLMLDYNIEVGDTVHHNSYNISKVSGIDSVSINGIYHKVWELKFYDLNNNHKETYHYIEGVGDAFGLSHAWVGVPYHWAFYHNRLFCFKNQGGNPIFAKKIDDLDNQNSCVLSIEKSKAARKNEVAVIPHPASESGYIQLPYQLTGTITIINQLGQVVRSERILNKDRWMLEGKIPAAGLYIYHIRDEASGEQLSGKFIYQQ